MTCDVALPRTPSLSSTFPIERPGLPRSTMNALIPRVPFVGSVTAWMTKVPATGALVQKVFVPLRTHSSFFRFAAVFIAAASDPLVGSVNAHAPIFRPLARSGMYFRFWASLPDGITADGLLGLRVGRLRRIRFTPDRGHLAPGGVGRPSPRGRPVLLGAGRAPRFAPSSRTR